MRVFKRERDGYRPRWYADIADPRKPHQKKPSRVALYGRGHTRFDDQGKIGTREAKRRALEILREWEVEAASLESGEVISISKLVELAKSDPGKPTKGDKLSSASRLTRDQNLERVLAWFLDAYGDLPAHKVTPLHIDELEKTTLGHSRVLQCVKRMFNYASERRLVPRDFDNPVRAIKTKRPAVQRENLRAKAFTRAELDRLFRICDRGEYRLGVVGPQRQFHKLIPVPEYFPSMFRVALDTGLRPGELRGLQWGDVDLRKGTITLRNVEGNKSGGRVVPLLSDAIHVLSELQRKRVGSTFVFLNEFSQPLTRSALNQRLRRFFSAVGLEGKCLYSFRHTYGLRLADAGVHIHEIKELMGHSSIRTTEHYLDARPEAYASRIRELVASADRGRDRRAH